MYKRTTPADDQTIPHKTQPQFSTTLNEGPTTVRDGFGQSRMNPALVSDLARFRRGPGGCVLLAVLASCVRHSQAVQFRLRHGQQEYDFEVHPRERLFRCEVELCRLAPVELAALRLTHLETKPPRRPEPGVERRAGYGPLGTLLWQLAKHGPTSELLPEIAGPVRYRLVPGAPLENWSIHLDFQSLLRNIRNRPVSFAELDRQSPLPRPRLNRLLNALYLQSALIVVQGK